MIDYLDPNPIQHFNNWFFLVKEKHTEIEVNAMTLATLGTDGFPKNRVVLLKQIDWEGFVFYTNYNSEKGQAIAKNNNVGLVFNWKAANKQVFIVGKAVKVSSAISEAYFETRPEGSQLGAWASLQSSELASREELEVSLKFYENKFKGKPITKPMHWGGYKILPSEMEFVTKENNQIVSSTKYILQEDLFWGVTTQYEPSDL